MNNFIIFLLCGLMIFNPHLVQANGPDLPEITVPSNEDDVGEALSPLRRSQRAPFTGVLLSPAAVAKISVRLRSIDEEIQIEINKIKAEAAAHAEFVISQKKAEFDADMAIIQANLEFCEEQKNALERDLIKEKQSRPSRSLWFSLGILTGAGITLTILFAANQLGI